MTRQPSDLHPKVTFECIENNPDLVKCHVTAIQRLISIVGPYIVYNVPWSQQIVSKKEDKASITMIYMYILICNMKDWILLISPFSYIYLL